MSRGLGSTQKKVLLLLLGGAALGLSGSPRRYFKILNTVRKEWREIEEGNLRRSIKLLYESKLVREKWNDDGTITLVLTKKGKESALTYNIDEMKIRIPKRWDNGWRIVVFDIPESRRRIRDALRYHLQNLGFYELQKSVFVHPFECSDEIEYIVEFYNIRKFVRYIVATSIDNELYLKRHFGLR